MTQPMQDTKQQLEEISTCSMCLELFVKPKSLPCLHTFCLECLQGFTGNRPGTNMKCPLCRKEFQIPHGGFGDLPSNFLIEQLLQVNAGNGTISVSGSYSGAADDVDLQATAGCSRNGTKNGEQLKEYKNNLEKFLKENEKELEQLDADKIKLLEEISVSEQAITKRSNEMKKNIDSNCQILLKELEGIKSTRLHEISKRINEIHEQSAVIVSFQQHSEDVREDGESYDMEQQFQELLKTAQELLTNGNAFKWNQLPQVGVTFVATPTVDIKIGKIHHSSASQRVLNKPDQCSKSLIIQSSSKPARNRDPAVRPPVDSPTVSQLQSQLRHASLPTVTTNTPPQQPITRGVRHPGVTCDGCNSQIFGCRYKCQVCPDFDLCELCRNCNLHSEHAMRTIQKPAARSLFPPQTVTSPIQPNVTVPVQLTVPGGAYHYGVTCDGCQAKVRGIRYKCTVCPNYDLCETCKEAGVHSQHEMCTIVVPRNTAFLGGALHLGVTCDGCEGMVRGKRFKCKVCPDFDLCMACKWTDVHSHHEMRTIEQCALSFGK